MSDTIKQFLVEIGFAVDASSQSRAESAVAKTEAAITATTTEEAAKRVDAEKGSANARLTIAETLSRLLGIEEQKLADSREKARKADADKDEKRGQDREKKEQERRDKALKDTQAHALKIASFLTKTFALVETAKAVDGFVEKVARAAKSFERLNYDSQTIGASPKGITAVEYAISQLGGTVEGAHQSLNNFGMWLAQAPQARVAWLDALGVQVKGARGEILSTEKLFQNFLHTLGKKPLIEAQAEAGVAGIDEQTRMAGARPGLAERIAERERISGAVGADQNKAAKSGTAFSQSWRRLEAVIDDLITRIKTSLFQNLQSAIDDFSNWITAHGKSISDMTIKIVDGITNLATAFAKSDLVQTAVNNLGSGLDWLSKYIASPDFKKNIRDFVYDIVAVAKAIHSALQYLGVTSSSFNDRATRAGLNDIEANNVAFFHGAMQRGRGPNNTPEHIQRVDEKLNRFREQSFKDERNWWQRTMPKWAGGKDAPAPTGGDTGHVGPGAVSGRSLRGNPNVTRENADVIRAAAKELGTTPEDLATVIGYETGGTFSPSKWGGAGGNYMGLIQFGPNERAQYGANEHQSFPEQMEAVKRYLKGRGFKPGMGLLDLYSTINAGSPGHYNTSDGNGTVRTHIDRMVQSMGPTARAFLAAGQDQSPPPPPAPSPIPSSRPVTDVERFEAQQRIIAGSRDPADRALINRYLAEQNPSKPSSTVAHPARPYVPTPKAKRPSPFPGDDGDAYRARADSRYPVPSAPSFNSDPHRPEIPAMPGASRMPPAGRFSDLKIPTIPYPLGITPALRSSIDNSRRVANSTITHNPTYNIHGGDPRQIMAEARRQAGRGNADLLRNLQSAEV